MKINYCPVCGREHRDFNNDIRFRCRYCGAEFLNWEDELHEELEKMFVAPKYEMRFDKKDQRNYSVPICSACGAQLFDKSLMHYFKTCPKCRRQILYKGR